MLDKRSIRRAVRYHPLVERAQQIARKRTSVDLSAIDLTIDLAPDEVAIDCGANVGDITSAFARTGAMVYAFEPNPLCYSTLVKRFAFTPNVECFHKGVMDKPCTLSLVTPKRHDDFDDFEMTVSSSFGMHDGKNVEADTVEIECIDLSEFIFSLSQKVGVLKLDIEGSEIEVVNRLLDTGAYDRFRLAIVETHENYLPDLLGPTNALRKRISDMGLDHKFRLDWQ